MQSTGLSKSKVSGIHGTLLRSGMPGAALLQKYSYKDRPNHSQRVGSKEHMRGTHSQGGQETHFGANAVVVGNVAYQLAGDMSAVVYLRAPLHPFQSESVAKLIFERKLLPTLHVTYGKYCRISISLKSGRGNLPFYLGTLSPSST